MLGSSRLEAAELRIGRNPIAMVRTSQRQDRSEAPSEAGAPADARPLDLRPQIAAVTRNWRLVATIAALVTLLALVAGMMRPRTYEATTRLMIDPRGLSVVDREATPRTNAPDQSQSVVESELRMLTSDVVLRPVMRRLDLATDPEFNGSKRYAWSPVLDTIEWIKELGRRAMGLAEPPEGDAELSILRNFQRSVRARREPQSFVIDLMVGTEQADKSARIANTIASTYLETRFTTQASATGRASDTMTGRLGELRGRVEEAEGRVERYKRDNDIVGASGRLVNEQQLSELNTQLVNARAETQKAQTRVEQFKRIKQSGIDPESIDEALRSDIIVRLRTQYAAVKRREASLGTTLLPNHPLMKEVRQELADARRSIQQEVNRLAEAANFDLERARSNEQQLERSLTGLKTLAGTTNEKLVKLRELEQEAAAAKQVYANFLVRSRELDEARRVDTSYVVPLSTAVPPRFPVGIPLSMLVAAGLLSGLGLGIGAALLRDRRDALVRGVDQVERIARTDRVAFVPGLEAAMGGKPAAGPRRPPRIGVGQSSEPGQLPSFVTADPRATASRAVMRLCAELMGSVQRNETSVTLVTASGGGEGKSTLAVNLALAAAQAGARVLLVDGDSEARVLSDLIGAGANIGLAEITQGTHGPEQAILPVVPLGIDLLTAGRPGAAVPLRASRNLASTVARMAQPYDLVVVDGGVLPQGRLLPAWARLADDVLLVVRVGRTEKAALAEALATLEAYPARNVRPVLLSDD